MDTSVDSELKKFISTDILSLEESTNDNNSELIQFLSWGRSDLGALFTSSSFIDPENNVVMINNRDEMNPIEFQGRRKIIQFSSNIYHSCAVTSTGEIYTCGSNEEGQANPVVDDEGNIPVCMLKPKIFDSLGRHRIYNVSCGLFHTVCVTASGIALSFGGNEVGQLGYQTTNTIRNIPRIVDFKWNGNKPKLLKKVACGDLFTVFLTTSGELYSCGVGEATGHSDRKNRSCAERIDTLAGIYVNELATGSSHSFAISSQGALYGWGSAQNGQLGVEEAFIPDDNTIQVPTLVPIHPDYNNKIIGVAAGYAHSLVWTRDGVLLGTGSNKYGQVGLMYPRVTSFTEIPFDVGYCVNAVCGSNHSLAIIQSTPLVYKLTGVLQPCDDCKKIYGWGCNRFGQVLCDSTTSIIRSPTEIVKISSRYNWKEVLYISSGGDQSFAIGLKQNSNGLDSSNFMLQKQFSTKASHAIVPVDCDWILRTIRSVHNNNNNNNSSTDSIEMKALLSTIYDIFSSVSLLSASFFMRNNFLNIDIEGLEECYKQILRLGNNAIVKLREAIDISLTELKILQKNNEIDNPEYFKHIIRLIMILWQCPLLSSPNLSSNIFAKLVEICSKLPASTHLTWKYTFQSYSHHLFVSRILKPLQEQLSYNISTTSIITHGDINQCICELLKIIYEFNKSVRMIPNHLFYNESWNAIPIQLVINDFIHWNNRLVSESNKNNNHFYLFNYSFLLSPELKKNVILTLTSIEQENAKQVAMQNAIFTSQTHFCPFLILSVNREKLLQDTLSHIATWQPLDYKKTLKVIFENEEGVDAGGVRKEFFQLIINQLMSLDFGLFVPSNEGGRSLWLNKCSNWNLTEFELIGILFGLAAYNGVLLDIHFPSVFYKKLLKQSIGLDDLISFDPILHSGLHQLMEYEPASDVEYVFCRNFEVEWNEFGVTKKHDLIENGSIIPVTGDNRQVYVEKYVQWVLEESIASQFNSLYNGFVKVLNPKSISFLRPDELELFMVGTPHLDFHELEQHTEYISGDPNTKWDNNNNTIIHFWQIVHALEFSDKQKLLLFITGSAKAPIGGLKNLGLKIQRMSGDSDCLPTSHTCFNILMLPDYNNKDKLHNLLLKAIRECEGFGLI